MYDRDATETSKGALVEIGVALGRYRHDLVLAGGWAPYFLSRDYFDHCGSIDIDFVLRPQVMVRYDSIRATVEDLGYKQTENIFRFKRTVKSHRSGKRYEIELDFLTEPRGARALLDEWLIPVQADLRACLIEGSSLVFTFNYEQEILGVIPGDGEASANVQVADIVGSLTMKGRVLEDRLKEKDSYDIYAVAGFHMGEPAKAAKAFLSKIKQKGRKKHWGLISSSLKSIERAFASPNSRGPYAVAEEEMWAWMEGRGS